MISMDDHRLPNGAVDWESYRKAQVNAGERCGRCHKFTFLGGQASPGLCAECHIMWQDDTSVDHSRRIRCPYCSHEMDVHDDELYDLYTEDEHDVCCTICDQYFQVSTTVSYTFTSPERVRCSNEK